MSKIRVAICDDYQNICINIRNYMKYEEDIDFIGYTLTAADCISFVKNKKPDILLLDIQLESNKSGIDIIPDIQQVSPETKIIMLTSYDNDKYIFDALASGVSDYIVKSSSVEKLVNKIRDVYNDCNTIDSDMFNTFQEQTKNLSTAHKSLMYVVNSMIKLSPTELDLLKDLYNGLNYDEIAKKRVVENSSVRSMVSRILRKFDAPTMKILIKQLKDLQVFELFPDI